MSKETLNQQIVHEAETTRQYARFKIPAKIEIDGKIYKVRDWSLGGVSVYDLPDSYVGKHVVGKMIFKFDSFETVIDDLKLECLYKKENYVGCRFTELTPQQISILNQIITAYINGDIITQDDILTAVTKIQMYPKRKSRENIEKGKAIGLLALIFLTIFVLLLFLGYVIYKKTYVVYAINGYVDENMSVIRAPYPSFIKFNKEFKKGDNVDTAETVAIAKLINGGFSVLKSPVKGYVQTVLIRNGEFRNTGEPIMSIIPFGAKPYIMATIGSDALKKLQVGYIAEIKLNNKTFKGRIKKILFPENILAKKAKPTGNIYANARNYVVVQIEPIGDVGLNSDLIGESVFIKIDTFKNKMHWY